MRKWDEQLLQFPQKLYLYKWYIDDGIGISTEGEKSLLEFANHANTIHSRIKVTLRWSKEKIDFLDTWVKLKDGKIKTDLFCKETDKHLYLQRDSDHLKHTKACIPYVPRHTSYGVYRSQLIRFARASSNLSDFNCRNKALTAKLLWQRYLYFKFRKAFLKFYCRHSALVEKYSEIQHQSENTSATRYIRTRILQ